MDVRTNSVEQQGIYVNKKMVDNNHYENNTILLVL